MHKIIADMTTMERFTHTADLISYDMNHANLRHDWFEERGKVKPIPDFWIHMVTRGNCSC